MPRAPHAAAITACLFAGALSNAGTVVHDNSDQTFVMMPGVLSYDSSFEGWIIEPGTFWPTRSPEDNAEGMNSGPELEYLLARFTFTGSSVATERYNAVFDSPEIEWAIEHFTTTIQLPASETLTYFPAHPFLSGDTIEPDAFAQPTPPFMSHGLFGYYTRRDDYIPLLGEDVFLGFRIHESEGTRYGFVRFALQTRALPTSQPFQNVTGITSLTYQFYTPTMWGYAEELDTPAEIPDLCPGDYDRDRDADPDDITAFVIDYIHPLRLADIDGDGDEDPDDITAFVDAFLSGCSYD